MRAQHACKWAVDAGVVPDVFAFLTESFLYRIELALTAPADTGAFAVFTFPTKN